MPSECIDHRITMTGKKNIEEIIRHSHKRSREFGVDKHVKQPVRILNEEEFMQRLHDQRPLLEVAKPVMDELYEMVKGSGFIIILSDKEGCILRIIGDPEPIETASLYKMIPGAFMDEQNSGTNAMGTAITEDAPVKVTANDHYIIAWQRWTCAAAPIHSENNEIIGTLNLTGDKSLEHPHTMGLVVAAVRAVESNIVSNLIQKKLFDAQQYAFSIMDTLNFGVFSVSTSDSIQWVNDTACRAIDIKRSRLLNTDFNNIFSQWSSMKQELSQGKKIIDDEHNFDINGVKEKFLFNA